MGFLRGLLAEYLRPWRLLLWLLMVLLAHGVVGAVLAIEGLLDGIGRGEIEALLVAYFDKGVWVCAVYATTVGTWWYFLSASRYLRTRACMYAVPVPWWWWGLGSGWVVLLCCGYSWLLELWGVGYWATPMLVAGMMSVVELVARCVPVPRGSVRFRPLAVLVLVGAGSLMIDELASLSAAEPAVAFSVGGAVAVGVALGGGQLALRRWRDGHPVERNCGFQPIGLERLCLEGFVAQRNAAVVDYPKVGENLWAAATALVSVMLPAYRWGSWLIVRVVVIRALFWAIAILAMMAGMFQLELLDDGYEEAVEHLTSRDGRLTFLMVPLLVATYIGGVIDSGRVIGMHQVILGRSASRDVLYRACLVLSVTSVVPVLIAVLLVEVIIGFYFGFSAGAETIRVLVLQCGLLMSVAPVALAVVLHKRWSRDGAGPLRQVGSMLALVLVLFGLSWLVELNPDVGAAATALFFASSWWLASLYLRWFFGTRELAVR